jgi:hypothetical protein
VTVDVVHRPTRVAGVVAFVAVLAASFLAIPSSALPALIGVTAGALCFAAGDAIRARGHSIAGAGVYAAGLLLGLGAVLLVLVGGPLDPDRVGRLVPATFGTLLLAAGVAPLRGDGSRGLVKAGATLAFVSVLLSGVFEAANLQTLLVAGVLLVVAVDMGEHAISMGEHLGRAADTWRGEVTHGLATGGVGVAAWAAGTVSPNLGGDGGSLSTLLLLLVGVLALLVFFHR